MKKAIIIGATSGIGKELAKLLVDNNYKVGITGRRTELLNELKETNPNSFLPKTFDVVDTKTSIEKLEELITELDGLDLMILSLGTGDINTNLDFEIDRKVIDVNVIGFTNIIDWGYNYFEKHTTANNETRNIY